MPERLRTVAPAKVNLTLEVLGPRGDGYHELASVMQTLALADEVEVVLDGDGPGIEVAGPCSTGVPADGSNLAWRAAEALAHRMARGTEGLRIRITKRIPPAGGLGGGASDAAAVLRLLGEAWGASPDDLIAAACEVGSDEAFLLVGGTALVTGRGERVEPLPSLREHGVVLLLPREHLEAKTGRMFAALAPGPYDDGARTAALAARLPCALRSADLYNRFEDVARALVPGLAEEWRQAEEATGEPLRLAGAGPTLFWIGPPETAPAVAARLKAAGFGDRVAETRTAGAPWRP
jgi:4-diphosphocytidyl-2-C-methyl-D-erythritol kinase